ncbi:hypothetical protein ACVILL_005389 [Bradyrhizobium sp. USDA 3364]
MSPSIVIARSDSDAAIHLPACGNMDCFTSLAKSMRQFRSPDGGQRNPGSVLQVSRTPDFAALHPSDVFEPHADLRTALSTSVFPSDQIAPGTLWLPAITSSNDFSIQLQSSSVIVSGGSSLMVWRPWPATWVRIL